MGLLAMTDDAAYEKIKKQYETLGRFVEAFELMVAVVRGICIDLLHQDGRDGDHDYLLPIAFHHQVMTAKPLFEIMRATIADKLKNAHHRWHADRDFYRELLTFVQNDYNDLVNKRNNLLHATWIIGGRSGRDRGFSPCCRQPMARRFHLRCSATRARAKSWRDGDDTAAVIHLAHAGLPRPDDPDEAARRLFVTDAFIKAGTSPIGISAGARPGGKLCRHSRETLQRVRAARAARQRHPQRPLDEILSFLGDLTASQAEQLGLWATRLLGPMAIVAGAVEVFRMIFVPSANRIRIEGDIKGLPGGHYSWNRDEVESSI